VLRIGRIAAPGWERKVRRVVKYSTINPLMMDDGIVARGQIVDDAQPGLGAVLVYGY